MLDHAALLGRFVGHRVCVTLYGQNKVWGRVATVCHDSVRLVDTSVVSDLDDNEWLNQSLFDDDHDTPRPRYAETVIQLNHIVSITCIDDSVPPPVDDSDIPPALENAPVNAPVQIESNIRTLTRLRNATHRTLEAELDDTRIEGYAEHFLGPDRLALELGFGLLPLVDPEEDGDLLCRVDNLRKSLAKETGVWLPPLRIDDNLHLGSHEYRVLVCGHEAARGSVVADSVFSIDPEWSWDELPFQPVGEAARWVPRERAEDESALGRIVVEPSAVIVGRLHAVARGHADELLSLDDVRKLLERVRADSPAVVEELQSHGLPVGVLRRVLGSLLSERVPLRNLLRVLESLLSMHRSGSRDPDELAARVRVDLGLELCSPFLDARRRISAILLDAPLEQALWRALRGTRLMLPPAALQKLGHRVHAAWKAGGHRLPLVVDGPLRKPLREALARLVSGLSVLAYAEIPQQVSLIPALVVRTEDVPLTTDEAPGWSALLAPRDPAEPAAATRYAATERRPVREPVTP